MSQKRRVNTRLIAIALLAGAILLALVLATGGLQNSGSSAPALVPTSAQPTPVFSGEVHGIVTVRSEHLAGQTWRFVYTVRNTGTVPVGGFELSSPPANLFHLTGRSGWSYYGSGVCGGQHPGLLVYWSTGASGRAALAPRQTARFGFSVNTSGVTQAGYALSWGAAHPLFGRINGPAPSSLPTSGPCSR